MIIMTCDWCGLSINQVGYSIVPIDARNNQIQDSRAKGHLHFDCLPQWVEYMRGGTSPPCLEKPQPFPPIRIR
jgi:hypothetical protein